MRDNKYNLFEEYVEDCLIKTNNPNDSLSLIEIKKQFKNWYKVNFDGRNSFCKEFLNYLMRRMVGFYDAYKNCLTGFQFKPYLDDELNFF